MLRNPRWVEQDADAHLAALIAEHRHQRIETAEDACEAMRAAERRAGREGARFDARYGRIEALHRAKGQVANTIINLPAASFIGVACKLILWRREAAMSFPSDFDAAHESFTFSAYQDLLRLTGLTAHAHRFDADTAARLRAYW